MKITSLSPTSLQLYSDCPQCFYLKYTGARQAVSPAMQFGQRLHKAIERYHKELMLFEFDTDLQPYLDEYMAVYDRDFQTCEEFWKLPLFDTGITFNLKIDLIKDDMLIDHKTSKRPYTQEFIDGQRQVTAYSWAWSRLYTQREDFIRFNVFITDPKPNEQLMHVIDTFRTKDNFSEWEEWAFEIVDGIENDRFDPKPARWHNYQQCPLYVEREVIY